MAVSTLTVVTVSVIFHFFVSEISPLDAKNVQVSFELNASSRDRIACDADAKFVSGTLQLTNGRKANETQGSAGRAIDYHGRENMLEVLASCRCKHKGPWKSSHKIDLTRYLPEDIVVGFSAAASISSEVYRLLSWNFTSTISRREREFSWKVTVAIDFITSLVITSLISFIIYYKKRCRPTSDSMEDQPESDMEADIDMALDHIPRKFTYEELSAGPNSQEMRVFRALQHLLPLWRPHQQTQVLPNNRKAGSEL
ncbi:hypothetical protein SUGI_0566090 [Cryptomeria japonica]|nr:hypothetical protein SUGI_0566090 [Cryptomeria japonica]